MNSCPSRAGKETPTVAVNGKPVHSPLVLFSQLVASSYERQRVGLKMPVSAVQEDREGRIFEIV